MPRFASATWFTIVSTLDLYFLLMMLTGCVSYWTIFLNLKINWTVAYKLVCALHLTSLLYPEFLSECWMQICTKHSVTPYNLLMHNWQHLWTALTAASMSEILLRTSYARMLQNKITINFMDIYKSVPPTVTLLHGGRAHASSQQNSVLCHQSARTASLTVHSHVTLPFIQLGFLCTISWFGYSGSSQS